MRCWSAGMILAIAAILLSACSGGGSSGSVTSTGNGSGGTGTSTNALTTADVQQVVAQAVAEAKARSTPAVVAVTDRVGNVLAVYAMTGAPSTAKIPDGPGPGNGLRNVGLQGRDVPATAAAIAKAITGAYLSSSGNAFSTRTASMIVQTNFPPSPAAVGLESGPLFGVQFSQLPCSDLSRRYSSTVTPDAFTGPKRSPLGLSADPGGFPLYKNGVVVGGVGVLADGIYGFDPDVSNIDNDADELVALAATAGFDAPTTITADKISAGGNSLRYSDASFSDLKSNPAGAPAYSTLTNATGMLVSVAGFYSSTAILGGLVYGTESSGVRPATSAESTSANAYILTNGSGANRFPPRGGADGAEVGQALSATETRALLEEAYAVMAHARAAIRAPLSSQAQVTISVVDTYGTILGVVRSPDAPIFGIDVSLQKARTAAFLSNPKAFSDLTGNSDPNAANPSALTDLPNFRSETSGVVATTRAFLGDPSALTGKIALSARAVGNFARPNYPDGQVGSSAGPFSTATSQWSPFATGLQTNLIASNLFRLLNGTSDDLRCTFLPDVTPTIAQNRLQNGLQIFPGGFPVYRGATLIGGIGVSGDGVDQDDMIGFLGLSNAARRMGSINLPAAGIRADQLTPAGIRPRFVNCPVAPFLDTNQQNVCLGL